MPIYEYECQSCHKVFERLQKMSDPNPEVCDLCGQGPVRKLISLSGFILKGSGYYTTENPSAARREGIKSETADNSSPKKTLPASVQTSPQTSTPTSTPTTKAE